MTVETPLRKIRTGLKVLAGILRHAPPGGAIRPPFTHRKLWRVTKNDEHARCPFGPFCPGSSPTEKNP